jgi:hypothetical protein
MPEIRASAACLLPYRRADRRPLGGETECPVSQESAYRRHLNTEHAIVRSLIALLIKNLGTLSFTHFHQK